MTTRGNTLQVDGLQAAFIALAEGEALLLSENQSGQLNPAARVRVQRLLSKARVSIASALDAERLALPVLAGNPVPEDTSEKLQAQASSEAYETFIRQLVPAHACPPFRVTLAVSDYLDCFAVHLATGRSMTFRPGHNTQAQLLTFFS